MKYATLILILLFSVIFNQQTYAQKIISPNDSYVMFAESKLQGYRMIHKFGYNPAVGTSPVPIAINGNYRTPTVATSLEILSTDAGDTAAGAGAQQVKITGLDSDFNEQTEIVIMNGITPVNLTNDYLRIYQAFIYQSGTYATQLAGSHLGDISIREQSGGDEWAIINGTLSFPKGQTQIAAYTIPAGFTGYVSYIKMHSESNKPADILFFQRQNADDVMTPFSGMRLALEFDGVISNSEMSAKSPMGPFPEKTDIGFMASLEAGTGAISVDFEIILVQND